MIRFKVKVAVLRAAVWTLRKAIDWSHRRGKIDDGHYKAQKEKLAAFEALVNHFAAGEDAPEEERFASAGMMVPCASCKVRTASWKVDPNTGEEEISDGWMKVPFNEDHDSLVVPYVCPDCAPLIVDWMDRHGLDYVPLNRVRSIGSTLEAAMLELAEDLDRESYGYAAERIRAELVLAALDPEMYGEYEEVP